MIKITNVVTPSDPQWISVILGMRNPLNSWNKSDTQYQGDHLVIGPDDISLMSRLSKEGSPCRKYARMLNVYAVITAPLYWWKQFDTYNIGVVKNSCSTMHTIHKRDIQIEDFSHEHLDARGMEELHRTIDYLNDCKQDFRDTKNKDSWWRIIQMLPESYNQTRTVMMNYESILNMRRWRANHKLDEWKEFVKWTSSLPYIFTIEGTDTE